MSALLSNIIFLNPWILSALAALPVLYFLLRVTPPAPKIIRLPTARFLEGLKPETQTPSKTPWWILLLRLLITALVIIALAKPVYNPAQALSGSGAIRLLIDNSWASTHIWNTQMREAEEILNQAGREKREIYIQTTTIAPGDITPAHFGPSASGQALSILKGLAPYPWPADYGALVQHIKKSRLERSIHTFWLSHGLDEGAFSALATVLSKQGGLSLISPENIQLPLLLKPTDKQSRDVQITIDAPRTIAPNLPVSVQILNENGGLLDQQSLTLSPDALPATLSFNIPETLRSQIAQFRLSGNYGAGGVYLLDERFKKRSVGIIGPADGKEPKPFIEARYYLNRALEPFTTLRTGTPDDILEHKPSVIILPDIAALPTETLNALERWVNDGGLLLRFAGPNMAGANGTSSAQNALLPAPLRHSSRSNEGTLSWDDAPKLVPFNQTSPLHGITLHKDITVRQQMLPDPGQASSATIWATLDDGTPLITARAQSKGLLVMIHTTASPDWSDLALSGTYVDILKRLVQISGISASKREAGNGILHPVWTLDGFGARQSPQSTIKPIPTVDFKSTKPSTDHPPGLYSSAGQQATLNLGDHISRLNALGAIPLSVTQKTYDEDYEQNLMPYLLYAALQLLLVDWLIMIILSSNIASRLPRFGTLTLMLLCLSTSAYAAPSKSDQTYASALHLAYIKTGNPSLDALSQQGLENLGTALARRTSAGPVGVAALNPESDTLAFFPLIYWPIGNAPQILSAKALQNLQHYLDHGGTILISQLGSAQALQAAIGGLNIPPLEPMKKDHVLLRSFYLLPDVPGGTLWVERQSANNRDGVSSVVISEEPWSEHWTSPARTRQQDMHFRFGVNMALYALTGNYKADQVHVPYILERLGR